MRAWTVVKFGVVASLLVTTLGLSQSFENSDIFTIAIPEIGLGRTSLPLLYVRTAKIGEIVMYVSPPQGDAVDYGEIFPSVNGAAAAMITESRAGLDAKVLHIELNRRPGFGLLPGTNTVAVLARGSRGKEYWATFIVHVPTSACASSAVKLISLNDLIERLRVHISQRRLAQYVLDCGVSFNLTSPVAQELRDAGAQADLMRSIEDPGGATREGLGCPGIRIAEILSRLEQHVPDDILIYWVRSRGVCFQLNKGSSAQLASAGASAGLLSLIRSMKPDDRTTANRK